MNNERVNKHLRGPLDALLSQPQYRLVKPALATDYRLDHAEAEVAAQEAREQELREWYRHAD